VFYDPPHDLLSPEGTRRDSGGWITGGYDGLKLWPTRPDAAKPGLLCVGPPKQLAPGIKNGYSIGASAGASGRVLAVPQGSSTIVLHRDRGDGRVLRRVDLGPQYDVRFAAVSPDGRWVVTCSHWPDGRSKSAQVWNADTGEHVKQLACEGSASARFSPDGRWLLTVATGTGSQLWEVGTWREARRGDGGAGVFSPDSRLLAIGDVFGVIRLVEPASGREVARLTGPEPMWYGPSCFSPDGTRLIAGCSGRTALYVWDLRLIRQQLKELRLDWDWPEFPPAAAGNDAARPLQVEILLGDLEEKLRWPPDK
jgi:WD40 repeat protein